MTDSNSAGMNASWKGASRRQKMGANVGPTKRGNGTKWMVSVNGARTPLGAYLDAASPAEVRLLEATIDTVAMTQPHLPGRRLRRYRHRWIVERTIGWLGNFRRLTVRYDRLMDT